MRRLTLDVYVDDACFGCTRAARVAADLPGQFAAIRVQLHRLEVERVLPAGVVAVPAFVLEGRVIQYGTPDRAQIAAAIQDALESG